MYNVYDKQSPIHTNVYMQIQQTELYVYAGFTRTQCSTCIKLRAHTHIHVPSVSQFRMVCKMRATKACAKLTFVCLHLAL